MCSTNPSVTDRAAGSGINTNNPNLNSLIPGKTAHSKRSQKLGISRLDAIDCLRARTIRIFLRDEALPDVFLAFPQQPCCSHSRNARLVLQYKGRFPGIISLKE